VGQASTEPPIPSPTVQDASEAQESIELPLGEREQQLAEVPQTAAAPYESSASEAPAGQDTAAAPLEPPLADKNDRLQARALAVGLHPRLSRALLSQLSAEDYRNARQAIEKAVADTPDDGQLAWPRSRRSGLALFQVHFVAGAAPTCRRYVVTITKDGWSTTALPMERCGARPDLRRAG
jgi:surface antigen